MMEALGLSRHRSRVSYAREKGRMTDLASGRILLRECMAPFVEAITTWRRKEDGYQAHLTKVFDGFTSDFIAAMAARVIIDGICREQSFTSLSYTIGAHLEDEKIIRFVKSEEPTLAEDILPKLKFAGEDRKRTSMRRLRRDWAKEGKEHPSMTTTEKFDVGSALLIIFAETTGVVELQGEQRGRLRSRCRYVIPTPELLSWLEKTDERHETLKPVFLPMVKKPFPWSGDYSGGYPVELAIRTPFVKAFDRKAAAGWYREERMPEVFEAVNRIQETKWQISPTLQVLKTVWEEGNAVAGLPPRLDEPMPEKPQGIPEDPEDQTPQQVERLKNYKQIARTIHAENRAHRSRRLQTMKTLWTAEQYRDEDEIFYPHNLDARGRAYPIPLFLNPQGSDVAKGLLRFAVPSVLDPECRSEWAVQGANTWGLDKAPFEERTEWVEDHWGMIAKIRQNPLDNREWMDADKPWQFLNWCLDDPAAPQVPICADGTNNGLQVIAALTGDEEVAFNTNLIRSERPQDIYQVVADRATEIIAEKRASENNKERHWAHAWAGFWGGKIPRGAVKRQVMTQPYGSTKHSCTDYTFEAFKGHDFYQRTLWPDDQYQRVHWLSGVIWQAITDCLKGPRAFMDWASECAKRAAQAGIYLQWELPTGFRVFQRYRKTQVRKVRSYYGWEFSMKWNQRVWTDECDARKAGQATPANVVHSIDAAAMTRTVNLAYEAGVREFAMVHDDFGTSAAHAPIMARKTREAYVQILSEVTLEGLHREWSALCEGKGVTLPPPPPRGPFRVEEILDSPYFFS